MSETAKHREQVTTFCFGNGCDLGSSGDGVVPWAIQVDLPPEDYLRYNPKRPQDAIHWRGSALHLPFQDRVLDFVHCVLPCQRVLTKDNGWTKIDHVTSGDYVLGASGFVRVLRTYSRRYRGKIRVLKTSQGSLKVTGEHPIATPNGWAKADNFRESTQILVCAPEIYPSKSIDSSHVVRAVTGLASLRARLSSNVIVRNPFLAVLKHDHGLLTFADQIWINSVKKLPQRREFSDRDSSARLSSNTSFGRRRVTVGQSSHVQKVFHPVEDFAIAIHDLNNRRKKVLPSLADSSDRNSDITLSVRDASEPGPIRISNLHTLSEYEHSGRVCNLKTDDGTFFCEGVLTHNCSHLLEDFEDWGPILKEWDRVLKVGGYMIIAVPDHERFRAAVARGQGDNLNHRHESHVGELSLYLHTYETFIDRFVNNDPNEYSILYVGRKQPV